MPGVTSRFVKVIGCALFTLMWLWAPLSAPAHAQTSAVIDALEDQPAQTRRPLSPEQRQARAAMVEGEAAMDREEASNALSHFQRAHALNPSTMTLIALSRAHEALNQYEDAIRHVEDALEGRLSSTTMLEQRGRLTALRQQLSERRVSALEEERNALSAQLDDTRRAAEARQEQIVTALEENRAQIALARHEFEAQEPDESPSIVGRWWFWTIIGVVVAGSVTTGVLLGNQTTEGPFDDSDLGMEILTLRGPP